MPMTSGGCAASFTRTPLQTYVKYCTLEKRSQRPLHSGGMQRTNRVFGDLEIQRSIFGHQVIVGEPLLPLNCRCSRELLADMESLLISSVGPWGNIQCQNSRICRPGLRVRCIGDWPHPEKLFHDR